MRQARQEMSRDEILAKLEYVFRDFFGDDSIALTEDKANSGVEGWDSVAHIQLIFEIEESFGIVFPADRIPEMTSIKAIIDTIADVS
jgi:acyl carrier protein